MRSKYQKNPAPSWQRKLVFFLWSLCGATLLLFAAWAVMLFIDSAKVDDCLDRGGRYDYDRGVCDDDQAASAAPGS